jgi:hypothetical protein
VFIVSYGLIAIRFSVFKLRRQRQSIRSLVRPVGAFHPSRNSPDALGCVAWRAFPPPLCCFWGRYQACLPGSTLFLKPPHGQNLILASIFFSSLSVSHGYVTSAGYNRWSHEGTDPVIRPFMWFSLKLRREGEREVSK